MFLFGRNKLKVRSEEDEESDRVKTFVEYYGVKQKDVFKVKVLNDYLKNKYSIIHRIDLLHPKRYNVTRIICK